MVFVLLLSGVAFKILFVDSFEATPDGKRNLTETSAKMYLNLPDATPSNAIIRTYSKEAYENMSHGEMAKLRDVLRHMGINHSVSPFDIL